MSKTKITSEIIKKLHKFSKIAVNQVYKNGGSQRNLFIAEEAVSEQLLKMSRNKKYWEGRELTDNLLFISIKNTIHSTIQKHNNTKKRQIFLDRKSITLEQEMEGYNLEIVDEQTEEDTIKYNESKIKEIENKLDTIDEAMNECEWITTKDKEIFVMHWLEGKKLGDIGKEYNLSGRTISQHTRRIRNVLNYLYEKNKQKK